MQYTKEDLTLEKGLKKEWLIGNGIGGYASTTIIGANTRKYHGLLVAALTPPARRHVLLSKVDEALTVEEKQYPLYTNVCKNYISEGYQKQISFEKDIIPTFVYEVEGVIITKQIVMEYGKNTVCILYTIKNGEKNVKLTLAPIMNYRDFHTMTTKHNFKINQKIENRKVRVTIDDNKTMPIYMIASEGNYIEHKNDIFKSMFYIEEEKRGFYPEEDLAVVGRYEINIQPKEEKEISFICSLEDNIDEINTKEVIQKEIKRVDKIVKESKLIKRSTDVEKKKENEMIATLVKATDTFIVYREFTRLHTVIAGYHWFLDWGRDALIAFEGLTLRTKRYKIAKEILLTFTRDIKFGLVPNGYSGYDNRPLYNSVDASLLLFEQIYKYLAYTKDYTFVRDNLYQKLVNIVYAYKNGIDLDNNAIYLDKDYLLSAGTPNTQNTWMDAKVEGFAVTPRNGKAVEINAMWYNALKILETLSKKFADEKTEMFCKEHSEKCKKAFTKKFYYSKKKCLYDVLGDGKIRPNQLFSVALSFPVLEPSSKHAKEMFQTVKTKLLNNYGLKTLAKGEKEYVDTYAGDAFKRDMSYHQGITWVWLLGIYADAYKSIIAAEKSTKKKEALQEEYEKFKINIKKTFQKVIEDGICVGSIPELFDSKSPYQPGGAISQAWSVAEILRIITE